MKIKILLLLFLLGMSSFGIGPNGEDDERQIVLSGTGIRPHLATEMPAAVYRVSTRMLSVSFPATGFEPYTLSVSSPYATLDYEVTSPTFSVYISPDVVEADLLLETVSGDIYYGSLEATGGTAAQ